MSQLAPPFVSTLPIDFLWEEVGPQPARDRSHSVRSRATSHGGGRQAATKAVPDDAGIDAAGRWSAMMAAAQAGDRVVYQRLLRECIPVIQRVARRQGVPPAAIDDVVQEVLLTVHRARQTYDPARPFVAWLSSIAKRRAIDGLRHHWRQSKREIHAPIAYEMFSDPDANPAVRWEKDGVTKTLTEAVAGLSSGQRQAVEHLALRQQSLAEASAATGRSVGALKVNLHRGLKQLQARLINRE
jgi:RNA polymerase sigma-70 factor (ECF subfamily)